MARSSFFRRPAVMLVFALASVGAVVSLMGRLASGPAVEQKRVQMTGGDGSESYPAFSPDSKRVAYSARDASKVSAFHIFVRQAPAGTPMQLTRGEDSDVGAVWSPDGGALAFERVGEGRVEYIVIPADGGAERKVATFGPAPDSGQPKPGVSWTADGKSLVVMQTAEGQLPSLAVIPASGGTAQRITKPPDGSEGDSTPAVSPAGDVVAFVRGMPNGGGDVWVCDLKGENPRRVTFDDHGVRGLTWSRDGQEILYSAVRGPGFRIWRIAAAGGSPREITIAGRQAYYPAIGRGRLAYSDSPTVSAIWRATLGGREGAMEERPIIRSVGRESSPVYSPDGTKIANISAQTDAYEIFISDADGKNRVQMTHLKGPRIGRLRWSPDGKYLIFDARADRGSEVFLMGAVAGATPARVLINANSASISGNGKWIYFQSRGQIWKATISGSNPEQLSKDRGGSQAVESPDGKYVYFRSGRSFSRVPTAGGDEEEVVFPDHDVMFVSDMQLTKRGIFFVEWQRRQRGMAIFYHDFATKKTQMTLRLNNFEFGNDGAQFSVSPDGKYILYPRVDQSQTNLMLVENFR